MSKLKPNIQAYRTWSKRGNEYSINRSHVICRFTSYLINVKSCRNKNAKWILSRKSINHAFFAFLQPYFIIKPIMQIQKIIEQSHCRSSLPFQNFSLTYQVKFKVCLLDGKYMRKELERSDQLSKLDFRGKIIIIKN